MLDLLLTFHGLPTTRAVSPFCPPTYLCVQTQHRLPRQKSGSRDPKIPAAEAVSNLPLSHQSEQRMGSPLLLSFSTRRRDLELLLPPSVLSASVRQLPLASSTVFSCSAPLPPSLPALVRGAPERATQVCSTAPRTRSQPRPRGRRGLLLESEAWDIPGPNETENPAPSKHHTCTDFSTNLMQQVHHLLQAM